MRLCTASSQHLSGQKIATAESLMQLDVQALRELAATLTELCASRNNRLIEVFFSCLVLGKQLIFVQALNERDFLNREILLKKTVLLPFISSMHAMQSLEAGKGAQQKATLQAQQMPVSTSKSRALSQPQGASRFGKWWS